MTHNARNLVIAFVAVIAVGAFIVHQQSSTDGNQASAESASVIVPQVSPTAPPAPQKSNAGSIADLVGPLEERLNREPGDAASWILLGKSYEYLGQTEKAQAAFSKAKELGSSDPAVSAALGATPNPSQARSLDARNMLQVGRQLDLTANPQIQTGAQSAPTSAVTIAGRITVAAELLERIKPGQRVFVFARTPDGQGVPLAVTQTRADQLPFDYRLDNTMSMVAGRSLSSANDVEVVARVSVSGDATRRPGDLMAISETIVLSESNTVDLEINQIVQE